MIFILGIERSATTWVANILDHHPQTDVYMEPLSAYNSRFTQWPDRFTALENFEDKAIYFMREFGLLKRHRRFLSTRFMDSRSAWAMDLYLANILVSKSLGGKYLKDFIELNFHRKGRQILVSKRRPLQTVIKELRLNFNAGLIPYLDDRAHILVVIREMASCVRSILHQIDQGNLVELERALVGQYGKVSVHSVAKYWVESYSALTKTLENLSNPSKIISHTTLLKNPVPLVREVFDFMNLQVNEEVHIYLDISNQPGRGKHSTKRSREELLKQMQKDRAQIYPQLERELEHVRQHPVLKKFIDAS